MIEKNIRRKEYVTIKKYAQFYNIYFIGFFLGKKVKKKENWRMKGRKKESQISFKEDLYEKYVRDDPAF